MRTCAGAFRNIISVAVFSPCSLFARRRLLSVSLSHTLFVSIRPPTAHTYININIHTRKGREHRKLQSIAMHQMARICFCLFFLVLFFFFFFSCSCCFLSMGDESHSKSKRRERETAKAKKRRRKKRAILIEWDIFFRFIQLAVAIRENQWQTGANKKRKSIERRNTTKRRGEKEEEGESERERDRAREREKKNTASQNDTIISDRLPVGEKGN